MARQSAVVYVATREATPLRAASTDGLGRILHLATTARTRGEQLEVTMRRNGENRGHAYINLGSEFFNCDCAKGSAQLRQHGAEHCTSLAAMVAEVDRVCLHDDRGIWHLALRSHTDPILDSHRIARGDRAASKTGE